MAGGRLWTREEDREALRLHLAGLKAAVVAKRLGRTLGTTRQRLLKLRKAAGLRITIPKLHAPGELEAAVRRMCLPGVSDQDVGLVLGVRRTTVMSCRRRLGLPAGCPQHAKRAAAVRAYRAGRIGLRAAVVRLWADTKGIGMSDADAAARLGVHRQTVREARERLGLPAVGCGRNEHGRGE